MATKKEIEFWHHNNRYRNAYKIKHGKECGIEYWYYNGWVYGFLNPNYTPINSKFPYLKFIADKKYVQKIRVYDFEQKARNLHKSIRTKDRVAVAESRLESTIGKKALEALKDGKALLHVWRRTNPHNQWIEDCKGETLWHSGESYENRISFHSFKLVYDSKDLIGLSLNPHEIGQPDHSHYRLNIDVSYKSGI